MVLDRFTIKYMETQCGRKIRSSADCEYLALDIESLTGEHIGINTIKRLLGFIRDEHNPRITRSTSLLVTSAAKLGSNYVVWIMHMLHLRLQVNEKR